MRTVFITGGRGDIGKAIADAFQNHHHRVIAPSSSELDLSSSDSCKKYLDSFSEEPDVIVHCAGWNQPNPFEAVSESDLERSFRIHVEGLISILKKLSIPMKARRRGHILVVGSLYGVFAQRGACHM